MSKNILMTALVIVTVGALWLAWRNSQPLKCAQLINSNGYWKCTLYIKQ